MKRFTFGGVDTFLLNDPPTFSKSFEVTAQSVTDSQAGLTQRETRRPYSATLRFNLKFSVTLAGENLRTMQGLLRALEAQPVLMPFWPAVASWGARAAMPITGGIMVAFKSDWSNYSVYTTVEPGGFADSDYVAPVLSGYLKPLSQDIRNLDQSVISVEFVESSSAASALLFDAVTYADGPQPTGYAAAPKQFPFEANYKRKIDQSLRLSIKRDGVGFSRKALTTFYAHDPFEVRGGQYALKNASEIASMLYWYSALGGQGASFWVQSPVSSGVLSADALAADGTVTLADVGAVVVGDYLTSDAGAHWAKVDSIAVLDVGLVAPFGVAIPAGRSLRRLVLCELSQSSLTLSFASPVSALASLSFAEVRPEATIPADETLGTTIGQLPQRCYLYDFSWTLDGVTSHERLTSYEQTLTYGGNSYTAARIEHGEIAQGLALDDDKLNLTIVLEDSTVMQALADLTMEAPVFLTLTAAEVSLPNAINAAVVFSGEVLTPDVQGFECKPAVVSGGTRFDRGFPRPSIQRDCNNALFDTGCTLARADWEFTAQVKTVPTAGYPFQWALKTFANPVGNASTVTAGFLSGGWIIFGTGANAQRRAILDNTAVSGAETTLTLDRDPDPMPLVNDAVRIYPGCDGQFATCKTKFDNKVNFFGFPFLPTANPSLVKKSLPAGGGKK